MKMAVCLDMAVCRIYCHRHRCKKTAASSETSAHIYQTIRHYIPEDGYQLQQTEASSVCLLFNTLRPPPSKHLLTQYYITWAT